MDLKKFEKIVKDNIEDYKQNKLVSRPTEYSERIYELLAATYLAGTENGLGRQIKDPDEINHRKEAYINNNAASKEVHTAILNATRELVDSAVPNPTTDYNGDDAQVYIIATQEYRQRLHNALGKEQLNE